jgi:dihydrolipoamide dehydrogenase
MRGQCTAVINEGPLMGYGIEGAFKSKSGFEISRQLEYSSLQSEVLGRLERPPYKQVSREIRARAEGLTATLTHRLEVLGVELIEARGRFVDPHTIEAGEERYRADHVVIATGSRPRLLPGLVPDGRTVLTSDDIGGLDELPSLLILGAGVIGCEFASIFRAMGAEVTLVDSQHRILQSEDEDLSNFLTRAFEETGIELIHETRFESMTRESDCIRTRLSNGREVETGAILLSVGRTPCSSDLGLESAGVKVDARRYIATDENMATNVPHIFAVGDVGLRNTPVDLALVHVAEAEGRRAAYQILGRPSTQNMDHVPYIIFTIPMIAGAGLNEGTARERHGAIRVGKYPYGRNHRAHAMQPPLGFVKLIVAPEGDDRILGVRVVGREADALATTASIMIERHLPYTYLIDSILPHPSLMECLKGAAHIVAGNALAYEQGEEFSYSHLL